MRSSTCLSADRPADLTPAALVSDACRGDETAWAEIVTRYGRLVSRVVGSYHLQEADAADAESSTWLRAVESLSTLRDPARLGGWLRTIARRECLAVLRHAGLEEPSDVVAAAIVDIDPDPEETAIGEEVNRAIADAMDHLPWKGRRLILALFFLPEMPYAEMAAQTGMPVGSLGPTRMRALRTMRTGLEGAGFGPDALAVA
jgi:RNA polymerase sigma factor (sigma-70 family)